MRTFSVIAVFAMLSCASFAQAQLAYPNKEGVSMGHVHLVVADVPAAAKFFETIGGLPFKLGDNIGVKFLDVVVMLREGTPAGPAAGSSVGHIAFSVPNSKRTLAQWNALGLKTATNAPDGKTLSDDFVKAQLARNPPGNPGQFFVFTPDGQTRIEVLQNDQQSATIRFHHVHFYNAEKVVPEMQAWYAKMFGATPNMRGRNVSADLPGVSLAFSPAEGGQAVVPTKGRAIDHIGFDIVNLEDFTKKLEASGVKFDTPYTKGPVPNLMIAFFTDPWGTTIELTEGLKSLTTR